MLRFKKKNTLESIPFLGENILPWQQELLALRGIKTPLEAETFLNPSSKNLHSPFLMEDMKKIVQRIQKAISSKESIVIYGDYDVDGICATTILYETLQHLGARVSYYIPSRHEEGYGLNSQAVVSLASIHQLMITVDCGITAHEEVALANNLNMEVIITDHHQLPENPVKAYGILNPLLDPYPFKRLCGAGVAGKLAQALTGEEGLHRVIDLVALATVADLVPLIEENRILVYEGLKGMDNSTREGIKALKEVAGIKEGPIKASQVAFTLAPRLNAAGRLSDASQGVELLLTKDREKARKIAENLQEENELRRKIEGDLLEKAKEQITNTMDLSTRRTIVVVGEEWNSGVIGLVASRIVEEHHYPTVVLSKQENQYVGSGRSISGVNLYKGLKACEKHFTRFGGHEQAAGLTIPAENVEAFIEDFDKAIKKENSAEAFIPTKEYDMTLSLPLVTQELVEKLEKLQPTGFGNPEPVFLLDQVEVSGVRAIGKEKDHMKLIFTQGNTVKEGIAFRMAQLAPSLTDKAKVLFVPDINHFQGVTKTQCLVKAIAPLYEKIPESFLEPFSFEKARIEDLLWGLSKDSRTAVANIPPLALEGEDDLTKLLKGSQGTLLLARTRTEGVKVFALVKEKVDLSLNIVEGSKGYHTLLIAPQLKNLKNHWENIVFLDGAFEDEVGLVQKQCPKAQIWLGNPKKEVKQTISSLALTDESLRELYRLMRKKVFFTLEDLAKERNLTKGQTLVGLWVFKQMDLINFELQPFSYTILPPTPCNIGDAPLLKSLREKN